MIRPLRICHRRIFMVLGLLLPIAFGLGIAARNQVPVAANLPAALNTPARPFVASDWEQTDIFTNAPVYAHTLRPTVRGHRAISLSAEPGFVKPDLLVYWAPAQSGAADKLPANAVLLGAFNLPELTLPADAAKTDGVVILYSLADGEVVAVSRPVRFDDSTK